MSEMPSASANQVTDAFVSAITNELNEATHKIRHCVQQLDDDQLWWRVSAEMNSIANLILHLCGNVRQWIVSGVGGEPDLRDRPQEFATRQKIPAEDLLAKLDSAVAESQAALHRVSADALIEERQIQGFDVTTIEAVVQSVAHFRGHAQEIVMMTRMQLGDSYQFDFVPGPNQQGGAANA